MAYANGKIPYSAMTALSTGGYLLAAAAAAFETWRIQAARAGYDLRPTSASDTFRPYDVQERIFRDRYRAGNLRGRPGFTSDVRYWPGHGYWTRRTGTAAAAVPGTSNHGKALAVDIRNAGAFGGPYHAWMSRTGPALGWSNAEGRSVNEPWHWVHTGAWTVSNPITGGGSIAIPNLPGAPPPIEEEDMTPEQDQRLKNVERLLAVPGQPFGWLEAINSKLDDATKQVVAAVKGVQDTLNVPGQPFSYPAAAHNALAAALGELAALRAAVAQVAAGEGADPEAIVAAARKGAEQALRGITITVDTKEN